MAFGVFDLLLRLAGGDMAQHHSHGAIFGMGRIAASLAFGMWMIILDS